MSKRARIWIVVTAWLVVAASVVVWLEVRRRSRDDVQRQFDSFDDGDRMSPTTGK